MRPLLIPAALLLLATQAPTLARAETITPLKNQSPTQLQSDQRACADIARQRTGFNPDAPAPSLTTDASKGAAAGAASGLLSGDPTKAAAAGAASAAMRHRSQSAEHREKKIAYDKARATCLTERGYTIG